MDYMQSWALMLIVGIISPNLIVALAIITVLYLRAVWIIWGMVESE